MDGLVAEKAVGGFGMLSAFLQAAPMPVEFGWIDGISKLGSFGLLTIAVLWLGREIKSERAAREAERAALAVQHRADIKEKEASIEKKDNQLMEVYKSVVQAFANNDSTVRKMGETLDRMDEKLDEMSSVRIAVGPRPQGD